ncbi:uncharacterized protein [Palaemon carinicauda]|uniref:uncharacterized protein n=1 Tax=Palaemon carinicauda TaxID=392227 RepID=UPI0035B668FE
MSNYEQLLRITSYLFKFCSRLKAGNPKKKALKYWVKIAQKEYFSVELDFLQSSANITNNIPPLVSSLNLFLDLMGIIRSRRRISKCLYFDFDVHNPILLPKEHRFTSLLIKHCHLKIQHLGTGTTVNYLREQGFWIPRGRSAVKTELSSCNICRKYTAFKLKIEHSTMVVRKTLQHNSPNLL